MKTKTPTVVRLDDDDIRRAIAEFASEHGGLNAAAERWVYLRTHADGSVDAVVSDDERYAEFD